MQAITVQINKAKALRLLQDLEDLDLIKILSSKKTEKKSSNLSASLAGCISKKEAIAFQQQIEKMRSEWERNF